MHCFEDNNDKHTITRNTDGHWKSCIARASYRLFNYLQEDNCNYILQTLLAVFLRVCFLEKFMNPKTVLCFFAKIGIIIKHERKVKNLKQEPTKLKFIILSFLWHWCRNIYLECGNREQIYTRFLFRSFSFPVLYCYMRNFCNLIGLEQWYFTLIWNTYMWKLQTFCG